MYVHKYNATILSWICVISTTIYGHKYNYFHAIIIWFWLLYFRSCINLYNISIRTLKPCIDLRGPTKVEINISCLSLIVIGNQLSKPTKNTQQWETNMVKITKMENEFSFSPLIEYRSFISMSIHEIPCGSLEIAIFVCFSGYF